MIQIRNIPFIFVSLALLTACGSPKDNIESYLAKAQVHYDEKDYVSARIEAMNAAQIEPKNVKANLLLSDIESLDKNWGLAIAHLKVAVDEDPWVLETRLKLGTFYVRAGMETLADEQAEVAVVLAPDDAGTHLLNARLYQLKDQLEDTNREIDLALEADPLLIPAVRFKAILNSNAGDLEGALLIVDAAIAAVDAKDAIKLREFRLGLLSANQKAAEFEADLKRLIEDVPENKDYMLSLAEFYSRRNRMNDTEEIFQSIVSEYPEDSFAKVRYVRFVGSVRGYEEALSVLIGYIKEDPDNLELRLMHAGLLQITESPDDALVLYQEIVSGSPNSGEGLAARNYIVKILINKGELDEARRLTEEILAQEETNSEALMTRAAFYYAERAYDDAITDLRVILRSNEKSQRALLLLARSHVRAGSEDLAVDAYRRLIEFAPNHDTASMELVGLLSGRGNDRLAEDVLRQKLEVDPEDRRATVGLIQAQLNQGDLDAAEQTALSLLEAEDATGLAEFQLGRVMQAKDSKQDAIAAYKLALTKNPNAVQPLQSLVETLVVDGRTDEAVDYLNAHLAKYPNQLMPVLLLGAIHANRGETEAAEKNFEQVIAAQPRAIRAYRALAALHPDELDVRISVYERGLDAMPQHPELVILLAADYELQNRSEAAIGLYEEALPANPESDALANNLASMLLAHRSDKASLERALELAKRFRESQRPAFIDTLGWALYRNGDFLAAIPYLEAAVEGADGAPQTHFHLGMAYLAAKDLAPAKLELEKAIRLTNRGFLDMDEAQKALASIEEQLSSKEEQTAAG